MTESPSDGLHRRDFLRLGLLAAPASLVAACGWNGGGVLSPGIGAMSRVNDWVSEHLLLSGTRMVPTLPPGTPVDPNMPAYFISDNLPILDRPQDWGLLVGGLVRKPMKLGLAQLQAFPSVTYTVKHHCVEGWTAIATWTGVPVHAVSQLVEPTADARYVRFDSFDMGYMNGWDLKSAMHPQTILAYAWNGRPLSPQHGAPLRLYSPTKLGYKLTKYLTGMTFTRERPTGYWEDQGYPWFGGI